MNNLPQNANNGNFVTVFHGDIDQTTEMLCNARDLHKFLNVGRVLTLGLKTVSNNTALLKIKILFWFAKMGEQNTKRLFPKMGEKSKWADQPLTTTSP